MRTLWPSYLPERELADRIEAFPFQTWVGPSVAGSGVTVLKIDYGREPTNPNLVRRVLDELVQLEDGVYLGKALIRIKSSYREVGFFRLLALPGPPSPSRAASAVRPSPSRASSAVRPSPSRAAGG
jgi:hypothetical protein